MKFISTQSTLRFFSITIIAIIFVGCISSGLDYKQNSPSPLEEGNSGPVSNYWYPTLNPTTQINKSKLVILGSRLNAAGTNLIYTFFDDTNTNLTDPKFIIHLKNQSGSIVQTNSIIQVANIDGIQFGVMNFPIRPSGSNELILEIDVGAGKDNSNEILFAKFSNIVESQNSYNLSTYLLNSPDVFEINGYDIKFAGWFNSTVPTPLSPEDIATQDPLLEFVTITIENNKEATVSHLIVELFSGGDASGKIINN